MEQTRIDVLERYLQQRSLTQEQFGLLLGGVSRQRVNQLLSAKHPTNDLLLRVAEALHVGIFELVDGNGDWLWFDA